MLDPPDRIPAASFALPENLHGSELWTTLGRRLTLSFHGCRHGITLFLDRNHREAVLWDPLTDVQRRVAFPPGLDSRHIWNAAALRSAGDDQRVHGDCYLSPFQLVFVCHDLKQTKASVCIYESKSGVWGDIITTATTDVTRHRPSVLVGKALCWLLGGGNILKFHCEDLTLAVIKKPADTPATGFSVDFVVDWCFQILRGEDNGLDLAVLSDSTRSIQLWASKSNSDGVVSWVLQNSVQLVELELVSRPACLGKRVLMSGYDEDTNVIFLFSASDDFILQLESKQFTCVCGRESKSFGMYYPYTSFYTIGRGIAGGDGGLENMNK